MNKPLIKICLLNILLELLPIVMVTNNTTDLKHLEKIVKLVLKIADEVKK